MGHTVLYLLFDILRSQLSPEEWLLPTDEPTYQIKRYPLLLHRLPRVVFAKHWTLPGRYWNSELSAVQLGEGARKPKLRVQRRRGRRDIGLHCENSPSSAPVLDVGSIRLSKLPIAGSGDENDWE